VACEGRRIVTYTSTAVCLLPKLTRKVAGMGVYATRVAIEIQDRLRFYKRSSVEV